MNFWRNITTGKDNQTHDIVKVALTIVTMMFPILMVWGLVMLTWAWSIAKPFDLMSAYEAFGVIIASFGAFLLQGGGSLFFKRTTEPDGKRVDTEKITTPPPQQ